MKKICLLLVLIMSLTALAAVFPASAAETESDPLAANLIVHYDFEGETPEEQLKDKGTAGTSSEDLALFSDEQNGTYISDGKAHISSPAGNYLFADFSGDSGAGNDIKTLTDGMTIFVKFSGNCTTTNWCDIYELNHVSRMFMCNQSAIATSYKLRFGYDCHRLGTNTFDPQGSMMYFDDDICLVAVTMKYNADEKTLDVSTMFSFDNGVFYTVSGKHFENVDSFFDKCQYLYLGKLSSALTADRGHSIDIYDFRIYNASLTEEQVKSITAAENSSSDTSETEAPTNDQTEKATEAGGETSAKPEESKGTDDASESASASASGNESEKKGCGSAVYGLSAALITACVIPLVMNVKKKKREE